MGGMGSGKSSLVLALTGEMPVKGCCLRPQILQKGTVGLMNQKPRIQSGTIKTNIVQDAALEIDRLEKCLRLAALDEDVKKMSAWWILC